MKRTSELSFQANEADTPRTALSRKFQLEEELLTELTMKFDPFTISMLKNEFSRIQDEMMEKTTFICTLKDHLEDWKKDLPQRDKKLIKCLGQLFDEIDMNGNGKLEWEEFTGYIIEKASVLNDQKKNRIDAIKNYADSGIVCEKPESPIEKILSLEKLDKIAIIEEFTDTIHFYSPETGRKSGKPLKIETQESSSNRKSMIQNAVWIPDQQYNILLTSTNDAVIRAWSLQGNQFHTANQEGQFPKLRSTLPQMTFAWNNQSKLLYTGERNGNINVWQLNSQEIEIRPFEQFRPHSKTVTDMLAIPSMEFLVSSSLDTNVVITDTITKKSRVYKEHQKGVNSLAFNDEAKLLFSAGFEHDIIVWNPYIDNLVHKIEGHNCSIVGVLCVPLKPQIISADIDGWVKIWDIRSMGCVQTFNIEEMENGHKFNLSDFKYINKLDRIVFSGRDLLFYDYDKNFNPYLVDDQAPLCCYYVKHNHGSANFISTITNKLKLYDAFTGELKKHQAEVYDYEITSCCLDSWKKRAILGDSTGNTNVYNIINGALMKTLTPHGAEVNLVCCSGKCHIIVTSSLDNSVIIHDDRDLNDSSVIRILSEFPSIISGLTILEHINLIFTGNADGFIHSWKSEGRPDGKCGSHNGEITCLIGISNYPILLASDSVGELVFWAMPPLIYRYMKIYQFTNYDSEKNINAVQTIIFEDDNKMLYTGDESGAIKAWSISKLLKASKIEKVKEDNIKFIHIYGRDLTAPDLSSIKLKPTWIIFAHQESIRHLDFIQNPPTLVSTSYDRRIKLWAADSGELLGALQQGSYIWNKQRKKLQNWLKPSSLNLAKEAQYIQQLEYIIHFKGKYAKKKEIEFEKTNPQLEKQMLGKNTLNQKLSSTQNINIPNLQLKTNSLVQKLKNSTIKSQAKDNTPENSQSFLKLLDESNDQLNQSDISEDQYPTDLTVAQKNKKVPGLGQVDWNFWLNLEKIIEQDEIALKVLIEEVQEEENVRPTGYLREQVQDMIQDYYNKKTYRIIKELLEGGEDQNNQMYFSTTQFRNIKKGKKVVSSFVDTYSVINARAGIKTQELQEDDIKQQVQNAQQQQIKNTRQKQALKEYKQIKNEESLQVIQQKSRHLRSIQKTYFAPVSKVEQAPLYDKMYAQIDPKNSLIRKVGKSGLKAGLRLQKALEESFLNEL